jgi:hypothetical protein
MALLAAQGCRQLAAKGIVVGMADYLAVLSAGESEQAPAEVESALMADLKAHGAVIAASPR